MPSPAFEKIKQAATHTVSTAVAMGDKAVRSAVPVVRRTAEDVVARVTRRDATEGAPRPPDAAPTPGPADGAANEALEELPATPATVARNVGPQRPVAPAPVASVVGSRPDPDDSPGGRLPPPR